MSPYDVMLDVLGAVVVMLLGAIMSPVHVREHEHVCGSDDFSASGRQLQGLVRS